MVQQKGNRVNHLARDIITTLLSRCNKKPRKRGFFVFGSGCLLRGGCLVSMGCSLGLSWGCDFV